ncbi:MAG TPA: glycoside hydrolase family 20 zincin-like fold domain-containing protein [Anaerolineaceae bacterium]|nr:glycoside hydrolase family 20 zincin-like fold domain-containing protein [Anaerolineaceae bacterium]HPN51153.1 glycoside hydrolase family 20 zincin-like fold domain-containing protein [Anaerolineaceae bacterium]
MMHLTLVPEPRIVKKLEGMHDIQDHRLITFSGIAPQKGMGLAEPLQQALSRHQIQWDIFASSAVPAERIGIRLVLSPASERDAQAYRLSIHPDEISIVAAAEAGLWYGVCTLAQIIDQAGKTLPCLEIHDWPDFAVRGVMLDISRDKVPTMETLLDLVEKLASWKVNQIQLYTEHTFAYQKHPLVWEQASPITGEEILQLDAFCRERYIELVPNQNTFGHMHRWLTHKEYLPLAEVEDGYMTPWGPQSGPYSLCPEDPRSLELVEGLLDELLPHFSSKTVNVGCDETFDVGQGRSKAAVEARGAGQVYLDYVLKVYESLRRRGYQTQFWGDIIIEHPDLVPSLPKDIIALEWGYEAQHPFDQHGACFAAAGIPFYVCPGTSSWCTLGGRTKNALGNLLNAAENGLKHGANGYLNTDWGDNGHWQTMPIYYLGLLAGAAYSWCLEANRGLDIAEALNRHVFMDPNGKMGRLAYDLGEVYRAAGFEPHNSSVLFWILQWSAERLMERKASFPEGFIAKTQAALDAAMAQMDGQAMQRPDAELVAAEFRLTAKMMQHALNRLDFFLTQDKRKAAGLRTELEEILAEYRRIWLERNRPGGLVESIGRLEALRKDYLPD